VTDGLNVYYITKPNDCADEELVVNIPIKGSKLVMPKGANRPPAECCDCKKSRHKKPCSPGIT